MATTSEQVKQEFKLTGTAAQTLVSYLKDRASGDADAPHRGLPFITEKGIVRVKPSDFVQWFTEDGKPYLGDEPTKKQILQVLKDAGLVQRVYPLPAHDAHPALKGKSFGLYTGKAPQGTSALPRVEARKAAPKVTRTVETAAGEVTVTEPVPSASGTVERAAASTLKIGDVIGTARTDSRAAAEANDNNWRIATITASNGGRVQARDGEGKMIRSMEPATEVWVKRA